MPSAASTIHNVMDVLPSKPGRNCRKIERSWILDTPSPVGDSGNSKTEENNLYGSEFKSC